MIATIGENMSVRRTATLVVKEGVVADYVHNKVADGLGKIGVLVALESKGDKAALADVRPPDRHARRRRRPGRRQRRAARPGR